MDSKTGKKLTPKQERFVEEYLIDLNLTQAAIRAGYSERSAGEIGRQNLAKLEILELIDAGRAELSRQTAMSAQWVLEELRSCYMALIAKGQHRAACKPLELIGRHFNAFPNRHELTGADGGPIDVRRISPLEAVRRIEYLAHKAKEVDAETQH